MLGWTDEKDPEKCQQYIKRIPSEMGTINIYEIYVRSMPALRIPLMISSRPHRTHGLAATSFSEPCNET